MEQDTLIPQVGQPYETFVEISKAEEDKDGNRIIYGRASDESLDFDNEVVESTGLTKSLEYFKKFGKFDWDHKSKDNPEFLIGEPLDAGIKNKELFVKGTLYKGVPAADATWKILKAGGKLGFSLAGKVFEVKPELNKSTGEQINRISKCLITKIAVTPHPKNFNTYCKPWGEFAKSLTVTETPMTNQQIEQEILKSLAMDTTTGQAMIGQSLENDIHKTTYGEDIDTDRIKKNKDKIKKLKKSVEYIGGAKTMEITKSLELLETGISDLEKAIKRFDEEENESQVEDAEGKGKKVKLEEAEEKNDKEEAGDKKKKKAKKEEENADDDENCSEPAKVKDADKDEDEDEDAVTTGKATVSKETNLDSPAGEVMKKAFEVTPVLTYIGEQLKQNNKMQKSLIESNITLLNATKTQAELIKSMESRINELENQPVGRKSIASAHAKVLAGAGQKDEMRKSMGELSIKDMVEAAKEGKINPMDLIKSELNIQ